MAKELKRGKLSKEEMNYIRQNCFDLSLEEMAEHCNRTIDPIRRFIEKENLNARDITDHEHLLATLRAKPYWREIRSQLMDADEIQYFENQWVEFFRQFNEDVTHTEEMQIIEVIRTETLLNRSMKERVHIMKTIEDVEELIRDEQMKPTPDATLMGAYQHRLSSAIGAKSSFITEHEKLVSKKERYLKDLKGTREQRKRVADDARTNFTQWMRELDKLENKERESFDMEVQARAADKARQALADFHEYEDGEVDQPLLNSETYIPEEADR